MSVIDLKGAVKDFSGRLLDPFNKFRAPKLDVKGALERNDFKDGFIITEFVNDRPNTAGAIRLTGSNMPFIPFTFGGEQRITKDYYAGSDDPNIQVFGTRDDNITIRGRFKAKKIRSKYGLDGDKSRREEERLAPYAFVKAIEAIHKRANLVQISMGDFIRYGFLFKPTFSIKTLADIDYEIEFLIIGNTPPKGAKLEGLPQKTPYVVNNELIQAVSDFLATNDQIPQSMNRSLADQIRNLVSRSAESINVVTGFVNTILGEIDATREAVNRALGLIKHSRNEVTRMINRIGAMPFGGGVNFQAGQEVGIAAAYKNASHKQNVISSGAGLTAFLASLAEQIKAIAATVPLARHKVVVGDTLQKLSIKFYNSADHWQKIYDHNNLASADLDTLKGTIIEIPRL